VDYKNKLI